MIIINNKEYNNTDFNVPFLSYEVTRNGEKKIGKSPSFEFAADDKNFIKIETTYDKEDLKNNEINERIDIKRYVSDIVYVDEKGWASLICGKYSCFITKLDKDSFRVELICIDDTFNEITDIKIDEKIKIDFDNEDTSGGEVVGIEG